MGVKSQRKVQMGGESTAGTAVAADFIYVTDEPGAIKDGREITFVRAYDGNATGSLDNYTAVLGAECSFPSTPATFEQLPHILEAALMTATPAQDDDSSGYVYTYNLPTASEPTIKTYTIETGDDQGAREMEYAYVESLKLSGESQSAVMVEANWRGRQSAATTFTAALTKPTVEYILAPRGSFYIDAIDQSFGSTQKSNTLLGWEFDYTSGLSEKYTVDSGQLYFAFVYFDGDSFEAKLTVTYEHNGSAATEITAFENNTPQLFQIPIVGTAYTTAGSSPTYTGKRLILNLVGVYEDFTELDEQNGNSIVTATIRCGYHATPASAGQIIVVNELSALP